MKVCYFYAKEFDRAIAALPSQTEKVYTGEHPWHYWQQLSRAWNSGYDLVTIEQDVIVTPEILNEFDSCEKDWCTFRYATGPGPEWPLLDHALGCTKFSASLQKCVSVEDILTVSCWLRMYCNRYPRSNGVTCTPSALCWIHIDGPVAQAISGSGIDPHIHEAIVDHIHDW